MGSISTYFEVPRLPTRLNLSSNLPKWNRLEFRTQVTNDYQSVFVGRTDQNGQNTEKIPA